MKCRFNDAAYCAVSSLPDIIFGFACGSLFGFLAGFIISHLSK